MLEKEGTDGTLYSDNTNIEPLNGEIEDFDALVQEALQDTGLDDDEEIVEEIEESIDEDVEEEQEEELYPHEQTAQLAKRYKDLQSDYTRKSQRLSKLEKEIEEMRKQREIETRLLYSGDYFNSLDATIDKYKDVDEYSPEYQKKLVAEQIKEMYEPLLNNYQQELQKTKIERFAAEHPDLYSDEEIFNGVKQVLNDPKFRTLTTEEAYHLVKGRKVAAERKVTAQRRSQNKQSMMKISSGSTGRQSKGPPPNMTAAQAMEWFEKNGGGE
jgi:phosphoglycolate phosphatase-like HAD superfamily hydrolase